MYIRFTHTLQLTIPMKTLKRIGLLLLLAVAITLAFQYPKLTVISGYAAKNMASTVVLAGRTPASVNSQDHDVPLISLATTDYIPEQLGAAASVWGLKGRTAICRDGLGCALLPESGDAGPYPTLKPRRTLARDSTPYPFGQGAPLDTVFAEVDYDKLREALDQAFSEPGKQRTRTVAVLYKDHLLAERYADGFDADTRILGWSMTKSVLATLYGIQAYQGNLNLDDEVAWDAWKGDSRSAITYNDLLRMQSGLAWDEDYGGISDVTRMLFLSEDMTSVQPAREAIAAPGEIWNYSSGTSNFLSGLLRRAFDSDQEYLDFPYRELIDRIGMNSMLIETDLSGNFVGSSYAWASTRDWARFGQLYLRKGNWAGQQLFDPAWVDYVTRPTAHSNDGYGAHFWLNAGGRYPDAPKDLYSANGYQGQFVFIIPSKDLVVVRTGLAESPEFDVNAFLGKLMAAFP